MKNLIKGVLILVVVLGAVACGDDPRTTDIVGLNRDAAAGKTTYDANCAVCHGADGSGTGANPNIKSESDDAKIVDIIITGDGAMPAFGDKLSDQEIADTMGYVLTL